MQLCELSDVSKDKKNFELLNNILLYDQLDLIPFPNPSCVPS